MGSRPTNLPPSTPCDACGCPLGLHCDGHRSEHTMMYCHGHGCTCRCAGFLYLSELERLAKRAYVESKERR